MNYYCTLFDSFYLSRGLAMYESLSAQTHDFHIYIFAFDDLTANILIQLNLDNATIVTLEEFESAELKKVKKERSIAEYCWTCTPSAISYVLKTFGVPECTYIDSDLFFYSDPSVLIKEMEENGKSVLITEHRFSVLPKLYSQKKAGRFCVQFITFLNEEQSLLVLEKWRKQCIDWCFARYEDGKFGDQKYLEDWPNVFSNIHILQHQGGGIAPWNLTQYSFTKTAESFSGKVRKSGSEFDVVFYHFQYVKFLENGSYDIGWYYITSGIKELFYKPYLTRIAETEDRIKAINTGFKTGITRFKTDSLNNFLKSVIKNIFCYNMIGREKIEKLSY